MSAVHPPRSSPSVSARGVGILVAFAVGAIVFFLAFAGGTYALENRSLLAIALWWAIIVMTALGLTSLTRPLRPALVVGVLLAGFAIFTLASGIWAASAERAFNEFNRASVYLAVYVVAVTATTRTNVGRWSDGIAVGTAATGTLALASRLFPTRFPESDVPELLPTAAARLSYPVEYWNGLAILLALGLPFLLRMAVTVDNAVWRALAVALVPALAAAIYLTSSRGGVATALVATVAFVALTARRWRAFGAVSIAALGAIAAIGILLDRPDLVNRPLEATAAAQGRNAALLIGVVCLLSGVVYALGARHLPRLVPAAPVGGRLVVIVAVFAALVGVAAADPVERFEAFKEPPGGLTHDGEVVNAHLLSGSGSGRWQFWEAAVDEWRNHPLIGRGAGTFEAWWAQHGSLPIFARDAHSLYLEVLGELGIVGFLLLAAAFSSGIVVGIRRLLSATGDERVTIAALLAAFLAYTLAAGIDWMWELTVVSVVGISTLGLLTAPATAPAANGQLAERSWSSRTTSGFALGVTARIVSLLLIAAQAIPLLAHLQVRDSQRAAARGDARAAIAEAIRARDLQPWASSPYLQLALVKEETGELTEARAWIREALERDKENWRVWLIAARLDAKAGAIADARRNLARAVELNPRSPLFAAGRADPP